MIIKEIEVLLPAGLHVLNITKLKALVDSSESSVFLKANQKTANLRDPISVLNLSVKYKDVINIICDGIDEEDVLEKIVHFLQNN